LQRDATDLGEHFYTERPRDFGARIASWLDNWVDHKSPHLSAGAGYTRVSDGVHFVDK
jgi:hypothetical protein